MKLWIALLTGIWTLGAVAAGGPQYPLESMTPDYDDKTSLQRGLATYSHYCMGCHSLEYQRYERTATDLGIDPDVMTSALLPESKKMVIWALLQCRRPQRQSGSVRHLLI